MMALQNANGPAAMAVAPSRGPIHLTKDKEMNSTIHSTEAAALPAPTIEELSNEFEAIWSDICNLQRKAYLLMGDIGSSFDLKRAREADEHSATFMFQKRGIDVTEWLAGEVWSDAADLVEKANKLYDQLEALQ